MALSVIDSTGLSNPFGAPATGNVMASWTTSARPASPTTGQYGYNTTYGGVEVYNGSAWDTITGGPAFSAYVSGQQASFFTTNTTIVVPYNTKSGGSAYTPNFDTNGCYNNTGSTTTLNGLSVPAYSFCPNVPGYYQVNAVVGIYYPTSTAGQAYIYLTKNGTTAIVGAVLPLINSIESEPTLSGVIYLNGTGDYITVRAIQSNGVSLNLDNNGDSLFSASFIRST